MSSMYSVELSVSHRALFTNAAESRLTNLIVTLERSHVIMLVPSVSQFACTKRFVISFDCLTGLVGILTTVVIMLEYYHLRFKLVK
jgi:hypothetical protein